MAPPRNIAGSLFADVSPLGQRILPADRWPAVVGGPLSDSWGLTAPRPIPPLREIQATGFDAIVQMREDLLATQLRSFPAERVVLATDLRLADVSLDDDSRAMLEALAAAQEVEAPLAGAGPGRTTVRVELSPQILRVSLAPGPVTLVPGEPGRIRQRWPTQISLFAVETDESWRSRVNVPDRLRDSVLEAYPLKVVEIPLGHIDVHCAGPFRLLTEPARFQVTLAFDYGTAEIEAAGTAGLAESVRRLDILPIATDLLRPLGVKPASPVVRLNGDLSYPQAIEGLSRFDVTPVVHEGNMPGTRVLSLCIETSATPRAPDVARIQPFLGTHNFAYFTTEDIVAASTIARWRARRLHREGMVVEAEVPVPMRLDDRPVSGRGLLHIEFGDIDDVALEVAFLNDLDAVQIEGAYQVSLLRLWDPSGAEITDLGDLGTPESQPFLLNAFLFTDVFPDPDTASGRFVQSLARQVLSASLRPTDGGWRLHGFTGEASSTLAAMVTRGELRRR